MGFLPAIFSLSEPAWIVSPRFLPRRSCLHRGVMAQMLHNSPGEGYVLIRRLHFQH